MKKLFVTFFVSMTLFSNFIQAQLNGWNIKVPITIHENSGTTLSQFQVPLYYNTQAAIIAGDMLADGADIRFASDCDGSNLLMHYIDSGINTPNTKVWVKVPLIPANDSVTIFMFYGNPNAPQTSSVYTFDGQHSATDSVVIASINSIVSNSQRGFRFTVNQKMLVAALGKREPTGTPRIITVFDFISQSILSQDTVPTGIVGQYNYKMLNQPIWLDASKEYILTQFQALNDGYYFGSSTQNGQHLTYMDMRYCNSCTQNTFPTSSLGGMHYGTPDFWYFLFKTATVAPTYSIDSVIPFMPTITVLTNDTVCDGDTSFLQANIFTGASYQWLLSNNVINGATQSFYGATASGLYSVIVTDAFGCSDTSLTLQVTVNPLPNATITPVSQICNTSPAITLSSATPGGIWSGNGITNPNLGTFDPSIAGVGTHTVLYSVVDNITGCEGIDSTQIQVLDCTSINELPNFSDVHIFPNPVIDVLTIQFTAISETNFSVALHTESGKLLSQNIERSINGQNMFTVSFAKYASGIYFIKIQQGGIEKTISVLKK
jgi:hypothetical protein